MLYVILALLVLALADIRTHRLVYSCLSARTQDNKDVPYFEWARIITVVWRRLVVELIWYPLRGWECWTFPSVGVWWTCRIARLRWQVRTR